MTCFDVIVSLSRLFPQDWILDPVLTCHSEFWKQKTLQNPSSNSYQVKLTDLALPW